jgi:hypothetical protein
MVKKNIPPGELGIHDTTTADLRLQIRLPLSMQGSYGPGPVNGYVERCGNADLITITETCANKSEADFTPPVVEQTR